ncbi:potassium transporter TrkA [Natronococcus pandeyae]|uniref:Potassium transporter TrkA n=1 Tax=Natronococcus pandeyae TaxID=2055836 RepID=A0A8J8TRK1_9EURY|nr:potassium transporter TrkA [Natronococcus pandeyae]TYL40056.1 potassium transporter TrkA [Natronococcus pandeyae]
MTLPVEILLGLYLGLLTGIVPAFVAGALGFLVRYVTGVTLPGFGVVVLALSIASIQGGLLGLVEPDIAQSPRLLVAVLVVLMLALYAHNQGDKLGAELPRRLSLSQLRHRTLSADVIEFVGTVGQVTIRPTGEISDVEGYPPLPSDLRATLRTDSWRLPADLPLSELERRLEERLRTEHDLADVAVSIDEQARASIAAAPPAGGLSRRVPDGKRAVSIGTLVPTGLARGDEVTVRTAKRSIAGAILSVRTEIDDERGAETAETVSDRTEPAVPDGGEDESVPPSSGGSAVASAGGVGRVTLAIDRENVKPLLEAETPRLVVRSRSTNRDFEAFALVKRAGYAIRRVTVGSTAASDEPLSSADVTVIAIRRQESETDDRRHGWLFAPDSASTLEPGDELFVAGPEGVTDAVAEAVGR